MKFTVVIPLYNKGNHINRAVRSVLAQTYKQFELLVVDDGSTDNGADIVSKIKDDRLKLIKQVNGGVSSARNKGVMESQGDYIGFLDADDAWKPNFLEIVEDLINKYPSAGAYATAYEKVTNGLRLRKPRKEVVIQSGILNDYFELSLETPLISASSVVIPRKVFNHLGGFSVKLNRGEDLEMWCRVALNYRIAYTPIVAAEYHLDTDNRATSKELILEQTFSNIADEILEKGKHLTDSLFFEEYMIGKIITKARLLALQGDKSESLKLLIKCRHTTFYRRQLKKTMLLNIVPIRLYRFIYSIRQRFISKS